MQDPSATVGGWSSLVLDRVVVNATALVSATVLVHPVSRFVLHVRAVDGAGNIGNTSTIDWWVDAVAPIPPTIDSSPDVVSLSSIAVVAVKATGDTSPGQLSFVYTLTGNGEPYSFGSVTPPQFSLPLPTNSDPATMTISGLPSSVYVVTVWSVSLSGLVSSTNATFSWQVWHNHGDNTSMWGLEK